MRETHAKCVRLESAANAKEETSMLAVNKEIGYHYVPEGRVEPVAFSSVKKTKRNI